MHCYAKIISQSLTTLHTHLGRKSRQSADNSMQSVSISSSEVHAVRTSRNSIMISTICFANKSVPQG